MRTESRVAVGSPTVRVMAILAATLLLIVAMAAAGAGVQRLLAADSTFIVDQSGSGDFTTISEAVTAAADGDTILIRPGQYNEAVLIDKSISLEGDGPRDQITIGGLDVPATREATEWCETVHRVGCGILIDGADARVSGVTFAETYAGLGIRGGAPVIEGVAFLHDGDPYVDGTPFFGASLTIGGESRAQIVGNEFDGASMIDVDEDSSPLVEGNVLRGGTGIWLSKPGNDAVVRGNDIAGAAVAGINLMTVSTPLIEDNVIADAGTDGILLGYQDARGIDPIVRGNTITGSGGSAIAVGSQAKPTIESNTLIDNRFAVLLGLGDSTVSGNDIQGEGSGIMITAGGQPQIADNVIDVSGRGISITRGSQANLSGNEVCGAEESIFVDGAEPTIDDTNIVCDPNAGATIVAADGSGDFTSIADAVAAAADGDTIVVRPGEYTDALRIDKDISVIGDGPRGGIVIGGLDESAAIEGSNCENEFPCMLLFDRSDASLSNVTIRGPFAGVGVAGGAPTIEGVLFDQDIERLSEDAAFSGVVLSIVEESAARVVDNDFMGDSDLTIQDGSDPLIENNRLEGWGVNAAWPGDDAVFRGNEIIGSRASGISIHAATTMLIEDNVIRDVARDGISADFNGARGYDVIIRGNEISGNGGSGIYMGGGANPTIEGNALADNNFGVFVTAGDATVRNNDISGGAIGLVIAGGGTPQIADNTIADVGRGMSITNGSGAMLTGNTVCGAEESIFIDRAEPTVDDTNTTCEPEPTD